MQDFEKLGVFYLGRKGAVGSELLLYDSRDLVTHAVCVGMTGSGKTGLLIGLETVIVRPKKSGVTVALVALVWAPHWRTRDGQTTAAWG